MKNAINRCLLISIVFVFYGCIPPSQADIEYAIHQTQTVEMKLAEPNATSLKLTPTTSVKCNIESPVDNNWEIILCEAFDSNTFGWPTGANSSYGTDRSIRDGEYIINYDSKNSTGYTTGFYFYQPFSEATDYLLSIDGKIDSKFKNNTWGVMVRGTNDGYAFSIDNNGNYFLTYEGASGGNNYIGNIKHGSNSAIKWGELNNITALVEGKTITFYVNGELIISCETNSSIKKEISYTVWAAEGVKATYSLDNILIKEK